MAVDHEVRAGRLWKVLINHAQRRETITYSKAAREIGIHPRPIRYALAPVQDYCLNHGLPPLTAIAVSAMTGVQGVGYVAGRPGDEGDIEQVFSFDWSEVPNPFPSLTAADISKLTKQLLEGPGCAGDLLAYVRVRGDAQWLFRNAVLKAYGGRCAICGLSFEAALEAAHILPWCKGRPEARIDPRNGILMCANHHRLFDAGHLTICEDFIIQCGDPELEMDPYQDAARSAVTAFIGRRLRLPADHRHYPSLEYLRLRMEQAI